MTLEKKMAASNEEETFVKKDEKSACKLCFKDAARYTCPRCNIGYCSSACYKSEAHAGCSEQFYKQCFMEGLKDYGTTPEEQRKVMDMLSSTEDNTSNLDPVDEEGDEEDLAERLQGVDLDKDPDAVWERLNDKERKEFQQMLNDGRLGNMLQLWEPWWNQKEESLVEELGEGAKAKMSRCPTVVQNITDLNKLLPKSRPADTVVFSVVNVLYSYCYVCRLHNGEHVDTPAQSAEELLELSGSLGNKNYCSVSEAIHACQQCLHNNAKYLQGSRQFSVGVVGDVKHLTEGPHKKRHSSTFVMAALSEIIRLLEKAKKELNKDIKEQSKESRIGKELREQRQVLFTALKKNEFLLSWANRYGTLLEGCIPELDIEFCTQSSSLARHEADKATLEEKLRGPVSAVKPGKLIEEIAER